MSFPIDLPAANREGFIRGQKVRPKSPTKNQLLLIGRAVSYVPPNHRHSSHRQTTNYWHPAYPDICTSERGKTLIIIGFPETRRNCVEIRQLKLSDGGPIRQTSSFGELNRIEYCQYYRRHISFDVVCVNYKSLRMSENILTI